VNAVIDVFFASRLIDPNLAPTAINKAFLVYMLPQGMFSVAVATVLFPALSSFAARRDIDGLRATMSTGVRQINLLLIPSALFLLVLATPVVRVIYQHGNFHAHSTNQVSLALFWFAFSLPFAGVNLLLTRTFFSIQQPWIPTRMAFYNVLADTILSLALYKPFGIAGLVIGTAVANAGMTLGLTWKLRQLLGGRLEGHQTTMITARIAVASILLAISSWVVWYALDAALGRSLLAQIVTMTAAAGVGFWIYTRAVLRMRVPEAYQVRRLVNARLGR
jgi:putative peptidoglycan lipid II flippase